MKDNPYVPLAHDTQALSDVYFKTDWTRATLGEIWNASPNLLTTTALYLAKLLRVRPRPFFGFAFGNVEFWPLETLPPRIGVAIGDDLQFLTERGFVPQFLSSIECVGDAEILSHIGLDTAGQRWSTISYSRLSANQRTLEEHSVTITARLANGIFLSTTNARLRNLAPAEFDTEYLTTESVAEVLTRHSDRLARSDQTQVSVSAANLRQMIREIVQLSLRFNEARGLIKPLSLNELAAIEARVARPK